MRFTIESAGGRASRAQLGRHTLHFGTPPDSVGEPGGPGPLAVFLAAAGACAHYFATGVCSRNNLPTEGLTVEVSADEGGDPMRLLAIDVNVSLPPDFPEALIPEMDAAVQRCPVHQTLKRPPAQWLKITPSQVRAAS